MAQQRLPELGLVWTQFASYHIDRVDAVARRMAGRYDVVAVEVATASLIYDWQPSGDVSGARKTTLFPGQIYEDIGWFRRLVALWKVLSGTKVVLLGVGYDQPDIICLSWLLRLRGRKVIMMTDSKFDDRPRFVLREAMKQLVLSCYSHVIVAGRRQQAFVQMLGFRGRRRVLPGYDTVSIERMRSLAAQHLANPPAFTKRDFIFVGRFVPKKNLLRMIDAYACYAARAGAGAHGLRLVGAGPEEAAMRERIAQLGIAHLVIFVGFLPDTEIPAQIAQSLALLLLSTEEQWGLVVNEAVALGCPVITSFAVGSCDALVRNWRNGFVLESSAVEGMARAMALVASSEHEWQRMSEESETRAWLGDCERLADAVEELVAPGNPNAAMMIERFEKVLAESV